MTATLNFSAEEARRQVNRQVVAELGTGLIARDPELVVSGEQITWRVPKDHPTCPPTVRRCDTAGRVGHRLGPLNPGSPSLSRQVLFHDASQQPAISNQQSAFSIQHSESGRARETTTRNPTR